MDVHVTDVSAVVKGLFYQLRSVQRSLTFDARRLIVTAFIASRLDYCNAVLHGVAKTTIQRLQTVVNAAARLVGGLSRFDHVTPVLWDTLHWLPIQQRIVYKIAVFAFDCVRGTCSSYFRGVCTPLTEVSGRVSLRLAHRCDLYVPTTRSELELGKRGFRFVAPRIWNSLPSHLCSFTISREQFRTGFKTHLFKCAYT